MTFEPLPASGAAADHCRGHPAELPPLPQRRLRSAHHQDSPIRKQGNPDLIFLLLFESSLTIYSADKEAGPVPDCESVLALVLAAETGRGASSACPCRESRCECDGGRSAGGAVGRPGAASSSACPLLRRGPGEIQRLRQSPGMHAKSPQNSFRLQSEFICRHPRQVHSSFVCLS